MRKLQNLEPERVFYYFEEISSIPRGSQNMDNISEYCFNFAKKAGLKVIRDEANNVIIYKEGSEGYKNSAPLILQGHLDMVCQKTSENSIDFKNDGIKIFKDGDFVKAENTSLGADNGIAVAIILAILESKTISHPPIEAVFTTDEEIGMVGAGKLDCTVLRSKRMINIDSGEIGVVTASCAGGSDFKIFVPLKRIKACGKKVSFTIKGLIGGHSGTEIDKGRINANILAGRFLNYAKKICDFNIITVNGGDKANAITPLCNVELTTNDTDKFVSEIENYFMLVKKEIEDKEEAFDISLRVDNEDNFDVFDQKTQDKLIFMLMLTPNGVIDMSKKFSGLVETSLNLGVLTTEEKNIVLHYALRSNKKTSLDFLEEKLTSFASYNECNVEIFGHYPAWEFKDDSKLQKIYKDVYMKSFGNRPVINAIHAGLECGIFASKIEDLDCISVGPDMYGIHSVNEKLSISSTKLFYENLICVLKELK